LLEGFHEEKEKILLYRKGWCEMNTSALAKRLGVSTKTIRRWIKNFDLTCNRNEHGHYVFSEEDYKLFCSIRDQLKNGTPSNEVEVHQVRKGNIRFMNGTIQLQPPQQQQLASLMDRIERTEEKIDQKADDVVSYQILQHRKEIDELSQKLEKLESYILHLEEKLHEKTYFDEVAASKDVIPLKSRRTKIKLFGFLL